MLKTKFLLNLSLCIIGLIILPQLALAYKEHGSPAHAAVGISELETIDTKIGDGEVAEIGKVVDVHYTGWLYDASASDNKGKEFDSSHHRRDTFQFMLGAGRVIKGWDQGVVGMKVGGERTLIIPPSMAYGAQGAGNIIPPNATLIFEVELVRLQQGSTH